MPYDIQPVQYDKSYLPLAQTAANVTMGQQFRAGQSQLGGQGFSSNIGANGPQMNSLIGQAITGAATQNQALGQQVAHGNFQGRMQAGSLSFNAAEAARGRQMQQYLGDMTLQERLREVAKLRSLAQMRMQNQNIATGVKTGAQLVGAGVGAYGNYSAGRAEESRLAAIPAVSTYDAGDPQSLPW